GYLGRGGEMNDGLSSFLRGNGENFGSADSPGKQTAALVAEPCGHKAGMKAVSIDARACPASRKFACKKNVAELRPAVHLKSAVVLLRLQIAEVELFTLVGIRRHVDHACGRRGAQRLAQTVRQHKIREMVGGKGKLQAVGGDLPRSEERPGVVDEHIN